MTVSEIKNNPPMQVRSEYAYFDKYRTLYDDITSNGVLLKYQDRHALAELAMMLVDMETCRAEIRDKGIMMKVQGDRNIITKRNPAVDVLQKMQPILIRMFEKFQMTPSSRKTGGGTGAGLESGQTDDGFGDV